MEATKEKQELVLSGEIRAYIDNAISEKLAQANVSCDAKTKQGGGELANRATLVVFSSDMDRVMASLVIATGAASMGMDVSLFFTFWGLTVLKKQTLYHDKPFMEKMMSAMLPKNIEALEPSKMNYWGAGRRLFKRMMRQKQVQSPRELLGIAQELGVRLVACQMSMDVMGITPDELIDSIDYGGVATYLADARDSRVTLFI